MCISSVCLLRYELIGACIDVSAGNQFIRSVQQIPRSVQQATATGAAAVWGDNRHTHSHLQQQDLCGQCWYVGFEFA